MTRQELPESDVVSVDFEGHVATIWLDREEKRNAFAPDFWQDFPDIVAAVSTDPETRAIVVAARGPSFTVGIDLKAFGPSLTGSKPNLFEDDHPGSDVAARMSLYRAVKTMQSTFSALADSPVPVIAAIHGHCIGAGVDLITACDIRYASQGATFSVRETKIGMVADVGTLQRLPHIIGPGHVADIVYTGRDFDAEEAATMGLVNQVLPDAEATLKAATETAHDIAANSPLAVQGSKRVLEAAAGRSVEEALDYVALWNSSFLQSNDLSEAVMAFLQKRPPEFTGE